VPFPHALIPGRGKSIDTNGESISASRSAALGSAFTTVAVYLAGFVQSYALVAPPISYWSAPIAALILFANWSALVGLRARRNLTLFQPAPPSVIVGGSLRIPMGNRS
jgi:hypothetical protein